MQGEFANKWDVNRFAGDTLHEDAHTHSTPGPLAITDQLQDRSAFSLGRGLAAHLDSGHHVP